MNPEFPLLQRCSQLHFFLSNDVIGWDDAVFRHVRVTVHVVIRLVVTSH